MQALVQRAGQSNLEHTAQPVPRSGEALIRVKVAGLCRTDMLVADGSIPVASPRILGHEFAGIVEALGPGETPESAIRPGTRVAVNPQIPCGVCTGCSNEHSCYQPDFIGIDRHGAFAEWICVPCSALHPLPPHITLETAAFLEPVAAALAVCNIPLVPAAPGIVIGNSRIANLTMRVMASQGLENLTMLCPQAPIEANSAEYAIESEGTTRALDVAIRAVRPGGLIIVKSRKREPMAFVPASLVNKELTIRAVAYGPFEKALALLATGAVRVSDMIGEILNLEDHSRAFASARASETHKTLFRL